MDTVKIEVTMTVEQLGAMRESLAKRLHCSLSDLPLASEELIKMAWEQACKEAGVPMTDVNVSIVRINRIYPKQELPNE